MVSSLASRAFLPGFYRVSSTVVSVVVIATKVVDEIQGLVVVETTESVLVTGGFLVAFASGVGVNTDLVGLDVGGNLVGVREEMLGMENPGVTLVKFRSLNFNQEFKSLGCGCFCVVGVAFNRNNLKCVRIVASLSREILALLEQLGDLLGALLDGVVLGNLFLGGTFEISLVKVLGAGNPFQRSQVNP